MTVPAFSFTTGIDIRFADLDAYGHVNNAVFFTYLETARIKLFQKHFGAFLDSSLTFLVVRAECDYRLPITLQDSLRVTVQVEDVRRSSFTFSYRLYDDREKLFATARTVMVCYDPALQRPVSIPARIRETFRSPSPCA